MKQLTKIKSIRISTIQLETLNELKKYDVKVSKFIRAAIREKIQRDWKSIKEKKSKIKCPF